MILIWKKNSNQNTNHDDDHVANNFRMTSANWQIDQQQQQQQIYDKAEKQKKISNNVTMTTRKKLNGIAYVSM